MDEATANSLGEKLGALDLTEDEQVLLTVLLGGTPDEPEVSGFENVSLNFDQVRMTYGPVVTQNSHERWIDVLSWSWGASGSY